MRTKVLDAYLRMGAAALVLGVALAACDAADGPDAAGVADVADAPPTPTPQETLAGVERLSVTLESGREITDAEFRTTFGPLRPADLKTWPEEALQTASSSLFRLNAALTARYQIGETYCTDDSVVAYETCSGTGYLCATVASLGELDCLWSTQIKQRLR